MTGNALFVCLFVGGCCGRSLTQQPSISSFVQPVSSVPGGQSRADSPGRGVSTSFSLAVLQSLDPGQLYRKDEAHKPHHAVALLRNKGVRPGDGGRAPAYEYRGMNGVHVVPFVDSGFFHNSYLHIYVVFEWVMGMAGAMNQSASAA